MYSARKNKELLIQVQRLREIDLCCILLRETSKQTHFFFEKVPAHYIKVENTAHADTARNFETGQLSSNKCKRTSRKRKLQIGP
jgi:hypothetical protein